MPVIARTDSHHTVRLAQLRRHDSAVCNAQHPKVSVAGFMRSRGISCQNETKAALGFVATEIGIRVLGNAHVAGYVYIVVEPNATLTFYAHLHVVVARHGAINGHRASGRASLKQQFRRPTARSCKMQRPDVIGSLPRAALRLNAAPAVQLDWTLDRADRRSTPQTKNAAAGDVRYDKRHIRVRNDKDSLSHFI